MHPRRYWAALNRLRALAERDYGGGGPVFSAGLVDSLLTLVRPARSPARRYAERHGWHATSRDALAAFVARHPGRTADGVSLARAYLTAHWPVAAPTALLMLPAHQTDVEWRASLVTEHEGRPLFVSLLDFPAKPFAEVEAPLLVILLAAPLGERVTAGINESAYRSGASPLEDEPAYRELIRDGFHVGTTPAGLLLTRGGSSHTLDAETLARIATTAEELVRAHPPGVPLGDSPASPSLGESSAASVTQQFLAALRDGDDLRLLELAHPRLFFDWAMEPTATAVASRLSPAPRPRDWTETVYVHASTGGSRTFATLADVDQSSVNCVNLEVTLGLEDGGSRRANVHLVRLDGHSWQVSGYGVAGRQLLGLDFPSAS